MGGGAPNKYSPTQTASFTAPAAGGAARLELTVRNRNIHVVGMGMCAAAGGPAPKKCANENQNCACTGQVRSAAPTECSEIPLLAPSSTASARQGELEVASA